MRRALGRIFQRNALKLINVYPPFLGAGVRVRKVDDGGLHYRATMRLRLYNRNYFGTHFGGSLYSMCDPFYVLILSQQLGRDYSVADRGADLRFRRPGTGKVSADFVMTREEIEAIRRQVDETGRAEPRLRAVVVDEAGQTVAEIDKLLSVRRRASAAAPQAQL